MPARETRKQDTHRRILESAARAMRRDGLAAPSVASVMADAGLTVGGFYAHFDSREALMQSALEATLAMRLEEWARWLKGVPPHDRRRLAAKAYLSRRHRDADTERCPLPVIAGELERADPALRASLESFLDQWAACLSEPEDAAARPHALAAIATMVGAMALARALGPTSTSDELLAAARAELSTPSRA
jgi:AcrR family transcriptional regulator